MEEKEHIFERQMQKKSLRKPRKHSRFHVLIAAVVVAAVDAFEDEHVAEGEFHVEGVAGAVVLTKYFFIEFECLLVLLVRLVGLGWIGGLSASFGLVLNLALLVIVVIKDILAVLSRHRIGAVKIRVGGAALTRHMIMG